MFNYPGRKKGAKQKETQGKGKREKETKEGKEVTERRRQRNKDRMGRYIGKEEHFKKK